MALGRSTKISILLAIDLCFFFVELIVGYAVGSLALVADSFHMLNDVMSLIVALYAIKLTKNNVASAEYSYGWHRAEILAALINGVFLLALCFSIFIEAIERFFSVPEVGSPKLVVIVGSLGLASNIIGLFLFHEHGHDHGPSSPEPLTPPPGTKAFPVGNVSTSSLTPLLPPGTIAPPPHPLSAHPPSVGSSSNGKVVITNSPSHRRSDSIPRRRRSNSNTSISFHPAQVRASLVQVAEEMRAEEQEEQAYMAAAASSPKMHSPMKRTFSRHETRSSLDHIAVAEAGDSYSRAEEGRITTTTTAPGRRNDAVDSDSDDEDAPLDSTLRRPHAHSHSHVHAHDPNHAGHGPSGHGGGGHGHAHGSMNMHAVLLHVIGDALGNVGVIATGLIIWLTEWKWKYYCDPAISLIITCIIFSSALPLVKSASFILLQGVPTSVSLVDVRNAILSIPGVISVHELHIWQLSESKIVASVHVLVRKSLKGCKKTNGGNSNSVPSTPPNGKVDPTPSSNGQSEAVSLVVGTDDHQDDETTDVEGGEHVYMAVASEIRRILHEFGIHSSTIQPEYATDGMDDETASQHSGCLIPCTLDAECDPANACCPPAPVRQGTH